VRVQVLTKKDLTSELEREKREKRKEREKICRRLLISSLDLSGFLPRAPLARTLGAEESLYIYVYVHI